MKPPRARLTRREAALVAAALLLPIPLFAQSGLSVPLPGAVSRGLGSLVTVDVGDERSGSSATGNVSENGSDTTRSARGSLRITRGSVQSPLIPDAVSMVPDVTGPGASDQTAGDSGSGGGNTPAGGEPEGDGGNAGSPGSPDSESGSDGSSSEGGGGSGAGSDEGTSTEPGARIALVGQGSAGGASVSSGDSGVDVSTENEGAPSEETGSLEVEVTNTDGSKTGVGVTVPGVGAGVPTLPTVP